jgi:hypothetical protein
MRIRDADRRHAAGNASPVTDVYLLHALGAGLAVPGLALDHADGGDKFNADVMKRAIRMLGAEPG